MDTWVRTSLILCVFGFLKEFRPVEPYVVQYLVGPWKNFTEAEVNQEIFPVITYCYLCQVILVFLLTDVLRYKIVIVLEGVSGFLSTILLLYGTDVPSMQVMDFFIGAFLATEIAYYTYIYAKVDRKYFQKVTSYTQSAFLMGRFLSSVTGQILVSTGLTDYEGLAYITLGALVIGTVWALFLPPTDASIYFHTEGHHTVPHVEDSPITNEKELRQIPVTLAPPTFLHKCARATGLLWTGFKDAYSNWYVLKWSLWWALSAAGFNMGYNYIQLLWEKVGTQDASSEYEQRAMFNGGVQAIYTILGAVAVFSIGWLRLNWELLGEAALAACALLQGTALIFAAYATNIWVAYFGFVVFGVLFHSMFAIVNAEVARTINEDSYGLIFGINTFLSLVCQTILTVVVAGEGGLALDIRTQYVVYGAYFVILGAVFIVISIGTMCGGHVRNQPCWLDREGTTEQR